MLRGEFYDHASQRLTDIALLAERTRETLDEARSNAPVGRMDDRVDGGKEEELLIILQLFIDMIGNRMKLFGGQK